MLVLGIETSTPVSSIALASEEGPIASLTVARGRGQLEMLVPAIDDLCRYAGASVRDVTGVAAGTGPGLFTSLRVGVATAKTLAYALRVPVVGISSLDLLAFAVRWSPRLICACTDAKRGELFAAFYRHAPGGVLRLGDPATWTPEALAAEVVARDEEVLFAGHGAWVYREQLARHGEIAPGSTQFPVAAALVELAVPRFVREEGGKPEVLEPLYVRRSDAEINWERRGVKIERPLRVKVPKRAAQKKAQR